MNKIDLIIAKFFGEKLQLVIAIILDVLISIWVFGTWITDAISGQFKVSEIAFVLLVWLADIYVYITYNEYRQKR